MKMKSMIIGLRRITSRTLSILALAGCLLPNAVHAGTCDATIADLVSWLKKDPLNNVTATIVANRPPAWFLQSAQNPTGWSEVTYSNVALKPSGGFVPGGLYAPANGNLLYDDRQWYPSGSLIGNPFDPYHTDSFGLIISATGTVYVYPANTGQSFAATCTPSSNVMYGEPAPSSNLGAALPFYAITFVKWASQPPPK
jgi:hypothetical protein